MLSALSKAGKSGEVKLLPACSCPWMGFHARYRPLVEIKATRYDR